MPRVNNTGQPTAAQIRAAEAAALAEQLNASLGQAPNDDDPAIIPAELLGGDINNDLGTDDLYDEDDFEDNGPLPSVAAAAPPPRLAPNVMNTAARLPVDDGDEMVETWVPDEETDDFKKITVRKSSLVSVLPPTNEYHDAFEIAPGYFRGIHAEFDYRWVNERQDQMLADRTNGFRPVRDSLDKRFVKEGGVIKYGDLVLMRRPKQMTEERAIQQGHLNALLSGEIDEYQDRATEIAREHGYDFDPTIRDDRQGRNERAMTAAEAREDRFERELAHRQYQEEQRNPNKRVFSFNLPWQRDLVAERHRASVGG